MEFNNWLVLWVILILNVEISLAEKLPLILQRSLEELILGMNFLDNLYGIKIKDSCNIQRSIKKVLGKSYFVGRISPRFQESGFP